MMKKKQSNFGDLGSVSKKELAVCLRQLMSNHLELENNMEKILMAKCIGDKPILLIKTNEIFGEEILRKIQTAWERLHEDGMVILLPENLDIDNVDDEYLAQFGLFRDNLHSMYGIVGPQRIVRW